MVHAPDKNCKQHLEQEMVDSVSTGTVHGGPQALQQKLQRLQNFPQPSTAHATQVSEA
jgi:hypothetical protein